MRRLLRALLATVVLAATPAGAQLSAWSVRTLGNVSTSDDCVRIRVDAPEQPADVGAAAFTIEQWLRCTDADNVPIGSDYRPQGENAAVDWIYGRIFLDRDINGEPNAGGGDFGASIHRPAAGSGTSVVRFGVQHASGTPLTIQGSVDVCDDTWHHVAVGRNAANRLFIVVDGAVDFTSTTAVSGSLAYPDGQDGGPGGADLVWGNEKHAFQSGYRGYLDELRAWGVARSAAEVDAARFAVLPGATPGLALYLRLEEGTGQALADATGRNTGAVLYGDWAAAAPGGGVTTSTITGVSSTSSTTSGSPTSTSSTIGPGPGATTTTTLPRACASAAECDDRDPCTPDDCVAGACAPGAASGTTGALCEVRRFVGVPLCPADPPPARLERGIGRRMAAAARFLDAVVESGVERARGRRKVDAALGKLAGVERRIGRAAGKLAPDCGAAVLAAVGRARAALGSGDAARGAR